MNVAQLIQLLSLVVPEVSSIVLAIKKNNGQVEIGTLLDSADAGFKANLQQIQDWMAAHQASPVPPAGQ